MAKPNDKQKAVAKMIEAQAFFWQQTNDITSPTHNSDLDECVATLVEDGVIDEQDGEILKEGLEGIFFSVIRDLK
jgi:hypothetical protein